MAAQCYPSLVLNQRRGDVMLITLASGARNSAHGDALRMTPTGDETGGAMSTSVQAVFDEPVDPPASVALQLAQGAASPRATADSAAS